MAPLYRSETRSRRICEINAQRTGEAFSFEALAHLFGERFERNLEATPQSFNPGAEASQRTVNETADLRGTANGSDRLVPFWKDLFGLEAALCEDRPVLLRLFRSVAPLC